MTRKRFRKNISLLSKLSLMSLAHIASRKPYEIIKQVDVAMALEVSVSTLNHHFLKLRSIGLITKENVLTEKGKKYIRYFKHWDKTYERKLRAHKIQITLFLSRVPADFPNIRNTIFKPITNKRYRGLKGELMGCSVCIYSAKKAVAVLPDIYANNDEEIVAQIIDVTNQLIKVLETEFEGLKVCGTKLAKFTSMHVAVLDSVFAESYIISKGCCYKGKRVAMDKSKGRYELEAEHPISALEDIELLVSVEELAAENKRLKRIIEEYEWKYGPINSDLI